MGTVIALENRPKQTVKAVVLGGIALKVGDNSVTCTVRLGLGAWNSSSSSIQKTSAQNGLMALALC